MRRREPSSGPMGSRSCGTGTAFFSSTGKDSSYVSHGLFGYAEEFEPLAERTYGVGQSRDLPSRSSNARPAGAGHLAKSSGHVVQSPRENRRHEEDRPGEAYTQHEPHITLHIA